MEKWTDMKEALGATPLVPKRPHECNGIERECLIINQLLTSAKNGQWATVWQILGPAENSVRESIINVIPENRRWGILHQAVYWNNTSVLQYLLQYKALDSDIKAKECTSECGETTRMSAIEIANAYKYKDISQLLSNHTNQICEQDIPTFEPYDGYTESQGLGLLSITLAAYKKSFHPKPIDPNKSIITVLGDIFRDITVSDDRRKKIQSMVSDSVYVVCTEHSAKIKKSKNKEDFFMNIVDTYTEEENYMYTHLNMAFRRQRNKNYRPTGDDLALGPFALMYQMLLLYWPNLPRESGTTYRRMLLSSADARKYRVGTKLVWQSVVSSSVSLKNAMPFPTCGPEGDTPVLFKIDNSAKGTYQPRNIEQYARYMEHERTYPAGAKFEVIRRDKKGSEIYISLKLLPS